MLSKLTALAVLFAFPLLTAGAATASTAERSPATPPKKAQKVARIHPALSAARILVATHRRATWQCQRSLRRQLYSSDYQERQTRSIAYTRYLARKWKVRRNGCADARERLLLRDFKVKPGQSAWLRAVQEVQAPYPGTASWLISCSSSEGGHGRWVPNSQGSGVGGWMQMYPSTFWRMFKAALADVRSRGFVVPSSAASWFSPLGQALGSAWGLTHGRRGEWMGAGC